MAGARQLTAAAAVKRIRALGDADDAVFLQRFFRTAPGEYGAGDRFLGVRVPATRRLARELRDMPLEEIATMLRSEWHEARLLALVLLANAYERATPSERSTIYRLYVRNAKRVNNWDLVDLSAPNIVGAHLATRSRAPLDKLARSSNLWERRIAIVATHYFIRHGEFDDTLRIARILLRDQHDLIHKAVGWMLREIGKRDRTTLLRFLDEHAHEMPRTTLRYAIEHLTPGTRRHYLEAKLRVRSA